MRADVRLPRWIRFRVSLKFSAAVGVLVAGVLVVGGVGALGLSRMEREIDHLVNDNVATLHQTADVAASVHALDAAALLQVSTGAADASTRLDVTVEQVLVPTLRRQLDAVRTVLEDNAGAGERLDEMGARLDDYLRVRRTGAYSPRGGVDPGSRDPTLAGRTASLFDRMAGGVEALRASEAEEVSAQQATAIYARTRAVLGAGMLVSLLLGLAVVLLLVRNLVPRIRDYARFAGAIAAGEQPGRLPLRGRDELAELGKALNEMVTKSDQTRHRDTQQLEFADTLQVTATEEEAHELVQRHLQRSLPDTTAVVLKRNNSENRLEPATPVDAGGAIALGLVGAEPRSCLAVRFGRTHREGLSSPPLLSCALCAGSGGHSTCEPLLVGGAVIGSVLVTRPEPLDADEEGRIRNSVAQAAPVLANLRNLALAEFRANNDSLTGLPNKRASDDTLKLMVAQASRQVTPLAVAMLDLDHFKRINDRFGHAKGDEVLAAVGTTLRACVRSSDFAGRFGGEEFLVLLPDTSAEEATLVAEKMRRAVESLVLPGVDTEITISIGLADLIRHGGSASEVLRQADRALYAAKAGGRNRTVIATVDADGGRATLDEPPSRPAERQRRPDQPRTAPISVEPTPPPPRDVLTQPRSPG